MDVSHFFIDRPRFAAVLSIIVFLVGLIALFRLPISEYPEVSPPQVVVRAQFPGANPRVIAETVSTPLEEQINGVDNLLYYDSQATSDGSMTLTATFRIGTDPIVAESEVQNRINRALPRLPEVVRQIGVTTEKSSPTLTMVVHMVSPDNRYDALYLRNYAQLYVRDPLLRISGMGSVLVFGEGDYAMRIWLDPHKLSARSVSTGEVVSAIREQNAQVAAGVVGAAPSPPGTVFTMSVNTKGRLKTEEEFADIIVRADTTDGSVIRIRDLGRVELSAGTYALRSLLNNTEAVAIGDYQIVYDPTQFVRTSISKVIETLTYAILLVALVVIIFLQTWRASIIPLLAVPVAVVGTFAVLLTLGFSINTLTLFGLVLAIGIVVDDAIVVVENVERNIESGLTPHDATVRAMQEVSGPIIAIALVLCAVFIPLSFVSGLSGQFYRQFAVTIAISTVISAFNSLTLSPALAAILLRGRDEPKDVVTRVMERFLGGFFRRFNRGFKRSSAAYGEGVTSILGHKALVLGVYAALIGLTLLLFWRVPPGFVPQQDKQYLIGIAQLPDGASLDRTTEVIRELSDIGKKVPGVHDSVAFPGLSINNFSNLTNAGIVFFPLDDFDKRTKRALSADSIAAQVNMRAGAIKGAFIFVLSPPPVSGLGNAGGFKLQLLDRNSMGEQALAGSVGATMGRVYGNPQSILCSSTWGRCT